MDLKQVLGNNIKHYRQLKGYSQEEFSELIDISQQTLSRIECGKNFLTSETLEKIPNVLGINLYELFMNGQNYTCDNIMEDIEKHLAVLKTNPKKLSFIHKIIRETADL
ncbi:helix-turn-helix transcriptional regulator [bacterium]|nr:helix-turn-helix transcriptional regulator [bacterium]MBQ9245504.1 helix-turn-helix transcriptional regulator [bacterium]MBQ9246941.1 helix-turn-helix transcriptional regulator [bacterium]